MILASDTLGNVCTLLPYVRARFTCYLVQLSDTACRQLASCVYNVLPVVCQLPSFVGNYLPLWQSAQTAIGRRAFAHRAFALATQTLVAVSWLECQVPTPPLSPLSPALPTSLRSAFAHCSVHRDQLATPFHFRSHLVPHPLPDILSFFFLISCRLYSRFLGLAV